MLSEITASRVALTDSPATPALSDDERVMDTPHLVILNPDSIAQYPERPLSES